MALIVSVSPMRVRLETTQPYRKLLVHFHALNLHHRLSEHLTSLDTWPFRLYFMVDIACHLQNFEEFEVMICNISASTNSRAKMEGSIFLSHLPKCIFPPRC